MYRYTHRKNEQILLKSLESHFVTAVLGARQVGKSTFIEHYIKKHSSRVWATFNMDYLAERDRVGDDGLADMIQEKSLQAIGGPKKIWVFIDEAQKCPALFEQIKILYDQHKHQDKIKFILTGSAFLDLHQLSSETLAGRIQLHRLRAFNLRETAELENPEITLPESSLFDCFDQPDQPDQPDPAAEVDQAIKMHKPFRQQYQAALSNQLVWGGLPDLLMINEKEDRHEYLGNYLQTYLEKDIRSIDAIADIALFQNLIRITAEQTGSVRNEEKMIQALGCSRNTLKKYRNYMIATLQASELQPFIRSTLKRLTKSSKIYLLDNGLISYLTQLDEIVVLEKTGLIGHRLENWFLRELHTWLDRDPKYTNLFYWRTASGVEVDFVVEKNAEILPFEVTYHSNIDNKKLKNLKAFMAEYPKAKCGVYVYQGPFCFDKTNNIFFIPAWYFV